MATNKKYCVEGLAQWVLWPIVYVSVMNEDGTPVTGLTKSNFKIGRIGNGAQWVEVTVTSVSSQGASHGFYSLLVKNANNADWNFFQDRIFTVEVSKSIGRGDRSTAFRGQCFAPNHSHTT